MEFPAPVDGDPYPEDIVIGVGSIPRYDWAHGRAYIHAPLSEVYNCLQVPEVVVDRRAVDRWSVTLDTEPEYDHSFQTHNSVDDVITVEFDINWRLGVVEGTNDEPRVVAGTFQKTFGTTFISLMRGSVVARQIEPDVTELELVEHIDAATGGSDPIAQFLRDLFDSLVAHTRGTPLPAY